MPNIKFFAKIELITRTCKCLFTLSYRMPKSIASKIGAKGLNLSLAARNVGYIYNSLPNNVHPESVRGNRSAEFRIRGYEPYIRNYTFTINAEF